MANADKDLIVTPARNSAELDPYITFVGANTTTNAVINMFMYPDSNGTISFEGSAGQLFSISNDLSGVLYSINDELAVSQFNVSANGLNVLSANGGNTTVGTTTKTANLTVYGALTANTLSVSSTSTANLTVSNNLIVGGNFTVSGTTTTINTQNLLANDSVILLNSGQSSALNDIGWIFQRYSTPTISNYNVGFTWNEAADRLVVGRTQNQGNTSSVAYSNEWMTILGTNGYVGFGGNTNPISTVTIDGPTYNTLGITNSLSTGKKLFTFSVGSPGNYDDYGLIRFDGVLKAYFTTSGTALTDSSVSVGRYLSGGSVGGNIIDFGASATNSIDIRSSSGGVSLRASNNTYPISLSTDGVERFRVSSNGFIGIGTTSPSAMLDVSSNSGRLRITQNTNGNILNGIEFAGYNGALVGGLLFNQSSGEIRLNTPATYFPTFYSNGVEAARFNTSGYLGIGTTTPAANLHVTGNSRFESGTTAGASVGQIGIKTTDGSLAYVGIQGGAYNTLGLWAPGGSLAGAPGLSVGVSQITVSQPFGHYSSSITFNPRGDIGASAPGVIINSGGTGVKTFAVKGFASQTANLTEWQSSTATALTAISANGDFTTTANVGIGVASPPAVKFQSVGNFSIETGSFSSKFFNSAYNFVYDLGSLSYSNAAGISLITSSEVGTPQIIFTSNNTGTPVSTRLYSTQPGNSQHEFNCQIAGYNGFKVLKSENRDASVFMSPIAEGIGAKLVVRNRWDGAPALRLSRLANTTTSDILQVTDDTTSVRYMTIANTGNVGIATTSPSAPLHVAGNGNTSNNLISFRAGLDSHLPNPGDGLRQYGIFVNQLGARYNPQTGIYVNVDSIYGVGIYYGVNAVATSTAQAYQAAYALNGFAVNYSANFGTQAIAVKGVAISANGGGTVIANGQGGWGGHFTANGKGHSVGVYADAYLDASPISGAVAIPLQVASNGTELMRVSANGFTGIGTTSPTANLHVVGTTTISGQANVGIIKTNVYTVATLPAAATAGAGSRAYVSDSNSITYLSIVGGGGANGVLVFSNGTNWLLG